MAKMTQAQCEAAGFNWNDITKTCTMPDISMIKMTLGRGASCDGGSRAVVIKNKLPLAVRKALIKAAVVKKKRSAMGR